MVGDRVDADLGAAHAAGVDGAIVLTGASDRATAEAARDPRPVAIAERLETLVLRIVRPVLAAKIAVARAAGALSRRSGRGGTSLPGKVLMRLEPGAIERLARRCPRAAPSSRRRTARRRRRRWSPRSSSAGTRLVHNRAGANMAGGVATRCSARARRRDRRRRRPLRGRRVLARPGRRAAATRARSCWQPVPRPARPLRRARDDRRPLGATVAAAPATQLVLNADDPLVADLGRDRAPGVTTSASRTTPSRCAGMQHASDAKHCRRCGRRYVYDAVYSGHLGHYRCPAAATRAPAPAVCAHRVVLDGTRSAAFALHAGGEQAASTLPLPGLYNVYNALGAAALARRPGRAARRRSSRGWRRLRPPSGAPRRSRSAVASCRSCWSRTRRAPTRCCARWCLSRASTTSSRSSTTASRTGATSPGSGTRTSSPRRAGAPRDVRGHARRRAGGAPEVRGRARRAPAASCRPRAPRSTPRCRTATAG